MDRYQRVEKPREGTPISENEIRITTQGRMRNYITYATSFLLEKGSDEIVLKAMGRAINKTVMVVELIKRRIVDLHQVTVIGSMDITDSWEPLEEGLLPLETTRHVSMITITLSKKELDTSSVGYQSPLPKDQVKPLVEFEYDGEGSPAGRGRGRGGRGRGRGRGPMGNGDLTMNYGDGGWNNRGRGYTRGGWVHGRGRGFQGRGRGGYGGRVDYQQELGDYNEGAPYPVEGRGRGRGFQGRGRGGYGGRFDYQQELGDYNEEAPYPVEGRGRGRGFPGRGRGGYGGRFDYQQELGDYNEDAPYPIEGRGRGRGRGQIRGRGRGFRANGPVSAGTEEA